MNHIDNYDRINHPEICPYCKKPHIAKQANKDICLSCGFIVCVYLDEIYGHQTPKMDWQ